MKKKAFASLGLTLGILAVAGVAQAGTSYYDYNVVVPKFNGSGYTAKQTKATSGAFGSLKSDIVGGSYTVDARMKSTSGTGSWVYSVSDGDIRDLPNSIVKGLSAQVEFSNNLGTSVDVRVTGSWKSN